MVQSANCKTKLHEAKLECISKSASLLLNPEAHNEITLSCLYD